MDFDTGTVSSRGKARRRRRRRRKPEVMIDKG
jgi:hypothetical protein